MSHRPRATRAALVAAAGAAALLVALPAPSPDQLAPATAAAPVVQVAMAAPLDAQAAAQPELAAARGSAVQIALSKVGKPYRYGATGPNAFDCSGLVVFAFKQVGVSLPRTSRAQSSVGRPISQAQLQPGDLVFFYKPVSHVGIYIGNGKIVHASTSGSPVKISDLAGKKYHSARRV